MYSQTLALNLKSQYSINELIFINSGSNYYVRLPINHSAALFAKNNEGKTSSLSALKLFLLPEVNFKNSAKKFNFSSGGTHFSDIKSFSYYFPSSESYIICEACNPRYPDGFCWVLFKGTDYQYHRIAIPQPYSHIEHLFWNSSSTYNDGIGALHADIGIDIIKRKLLSKEYGGQLILEQKMISEAIYSRASSQEDHTKFCLLPMIQKSSSDSIKTVRALLDMAFDLSNASTTSLPVAIGSIIDGKSLSVVQDGGIFLNLDEKLDEWRQLQREQHFLSLIEDKLPLWAEFNQNLAEYKQNKIDANTSFGELQAYIVHHDEYLSQELEALQILEAEKEGALNQINQEYDSAKNDVIGLQVSLTEKKNLSQKYLEKLEIIATLKEKYKQEGITHDAKIIEDLRSQIKQNETVIDSLNNASKTQNELQRLTQQINDLSHKKSSQKKLLEQYQQKGVFLESFPLHTSSVLISLNKNLGLIPFKATPEESQVITDFAGLFKQQATELVFRDQSSSSIEFITYSEADIIAEIEQSIKNFTQNITELEQQRSFLYQSSKEMPEQRKNLVKDFQIKNSELKSLVDDLNGEELLSHSLLELQEQQEFNEEKLVTAQAQQALLQQKLQDIKTEYHSSREKSEKHKARLQELSRRQNDLKTLEITHRNYFGNNSSDSVNHNINALYRSQYVAETLAQLQQKVNELNKLNELIHRQLMIFIDYRLIEMTPEEKHKLVLSSQEFETCYSTLQNSFETLEAKQNHYYTRLMAHNNTVQTSIQIINNTKELIEHYIHHLNRQLEGYQISNLDTVRIDVDFHAQYTSATKAMNQIAHTLHETYPKELYESIQAFQDNFYVKQSRKMDIAKIIEKVTYIFVRDGVEERDPQSNGTNSMINAVLLAILFNSMIPADLRLQLPVVFDEVGKLDEGNLNEIYKIVTAQNLVLFVATPEPTGAIASVIALFHDLSCFQAIDVEIHNKAKTIYFQGLEEQLIDIPIDREISNENK